MNIKIGALSALLAIAYLYPIAAASAQDEIHATRIVRFNDLDLTVPRDRTILDERIRLAARRACEELNRSFDADVLDCVARLVRQAKPQRAAQIERHRRRADRLAERAPPVAQQQAH